MKRLIAGAAAVGILAGGAVLGAEASATPGVAPAAPGVTKVIPQYHGQMVPRTHPDGKRFNRPDGKRFAITAAYRPAVKRFSKHL